MLVTYNTYTDIHTYNIYIYSICHQHFCYSLIALFLTLILFPSTGPDAKFHIQCFLCLTNGLSLLWGNPFFFFHIYYQ